MLRWLRRMAGTADGAEGPGALGSAVEAALVAAELGQGLADTPFLGPSLAADLGDSSVPRRRPSPRRWRSVADLSQPATGRHGELPSTTVAIDADWCAERPWSSADVGLRELGGQGRA